MGEFLVHDKHINAIHLSVIIIISLMVVRSCPVLLNQSIKERGKLGLEVCTPKPLRSD